MIRTCKKAGFGSLRYYSESTTQHSGLGFGVIQGLQ